MEEKPHAFGHPVVHRRAGTLILLLALCTHHL
jgi:hypothetical protein